MRIRTVKPEFWQNEGLARLSLAARLFFIGLWNEADDHGRFRANPSYLKGVIFPYDDMTAQAVRALLEELQGNGRIELYENEGCSFGFLPGFDKHQKIDGRWESKLPPPPEKHETTPNESQTTPIPGCISLNHTNCPPLEQGTGNRDQGEEQGTYTAPAGAVVSFPHPQAGLAKEPKKKTPRLKQPPALTPEQAEVFDHWKARNDAPRAHPDEKRQAVIQGAFALGYTVEECKQAVDGNRASEFHRGKNDRGKIYNSLGLIFRDAEHIDQFIAEARASSPPAEPEPEKPLSEKFQYPCGGCGKPIVLPSEMAFRQNEPWHLKCLSTVRDATAETIGAPAL